METKGQIPEQSRPTQITVGWIEPRSRLIGTRSWELDGRAVDLIHHYALSRATKKKEDDL